MKIAALDGWPPNGIEEMRHQKGSTVCCRGCRGFGEGVVASSTYMRYLPWTTKAAVPFGPECQATASEARVVPPEGGCYDVRMLRPSLVQGSRKFVMVRRKGSCLDFWRAC